MKYIILLLFSFNLQASDIWIQKLTSEQTGNGYMFAFQDDGIVRCWGMPDMLNQSFIPSTWMKVPEAAVSYNWDTFLAGCQSLPAIPRTQGGPLYSINHRMRVEQIGTVPTGVPCGDKIMYISYLRAVTYNGQYGFAACS